MSSPPEDDTFPDDITALLAKETVDYDRECIDIPAAKFTADDGKNEDTNRYVGCVVTNSAGELLLVKHREDIHKTGWVLPGGSVEPGESFEEAAQRELMEETGVQCRIGRPIQVVEQVFRNETDHTQSNTGYFVLFRTVLESETLTTDPGTDEEGIVDIDWFKAVPNETPQPDLLQKFLV